MSKTTDPLFCINLLQTARTRDGVIFCPQDDIWLARDAIIYHKFDFRTFQGASKNLVGSFKAFLSWHIQHYALTSTAHYFGQFKYFFAVMAGSGHFLEQIEPSHIINYRSHLPERRAWYLSSLSSAIKKWHSLGFPGVDPRTIKLLRQLRLRGIEKGVAVTTMDPHKGPFTDLELQSIQASLNQAYSAGRIRTNVYLLIWLFMLLGGELINGIPWRRPS